MKGCEGDYEIILKTNGVVDLGYFCISIKYIKRESTTPFYFK